MVANLGNMAETFDRYNILYFEGKLPAPQFDLLHSFRTCGYFQYTKGGWFDKTLYDPTIFITDYYDFTEGQFKDIMVHEMIHYYLAYFGLDKSCSHGRKFKKMAKRLNQSFNLNVTKKLDTSKYERRKGTSFVSYWLSQII